MVTFEVTNAHETRARGTRPRRCASRVSEQRGGAAEAAQGVFRSWRTLGEKRTLRMALPRRAMSVWDAKTREWRVLPGSTRCTWGSHARDEKVSLAFNVDHGESRRDNRTRRPRRGAVDHPTTPPTRRSIARNNTRQVTRHTRGDERERRRRAVDTGRRRGRRRSSGRSGVGFPSENRRKRKRSDPARIVRFPSCALRLMRAARHRFFPCLEQPSPPVPAPLSRARDARSAMSTPDEGSGDDPLLLGAERSTAPAFAANAPSRPTRSILSTTRTTTARASRVPTGSTA